MKKILALVLALAMVLSVASFASADEGKAISLKTHEDVDRYFESM